MHCAIILRFLLTSFGALSSALPSSITERHKPTIPALPFNFTYLFTAHLDIGTASRPITIPGGILVNEPVTSGTVSGPVINATIQGGFAHASIINSTLQVPAIDLYGVTEDGQAVYIHETGIGSNAAQITRIELSIAGKYLPLADGYILASVNPNANRTAVTVEGWLVQNTYY